MGVRLFIFCVLLYEAILISSPEAVTLPFTDLVATVTPRKPKPLSPEEAAQIPRIPKSGDAVLNYFKSQFPEKDLASLRCDFSAPLALTSASKTLPAANVESLIHKNDVFLNSPNNVYASGIPSSTVLPGSYNLITESNILTDKLNLPTPYISPLITTSLQPQYKNGYLNDYSINPFKSPLLNYPVNPGRSGIFTSTANTGSTLPSVSTLPNVCVQPQYTNGYSNNFSTNPFKSSLVNYPMNPDYRSLLNSNTVSTEPSVNTLPNLCVQSQYTNGYSMDLFKSPLINIPVNPDYKSGITTFNLNTGSTFPSVSTLPNVRIQPLNASRYSNKYSTNPFKSTFVNFPHIPDSKSGFPPFISNTGSTISSVNSLPNVSIQPKYTNGYLNNLPTNPYLPTLNSQIPDYRSIIPPFSVKSGLSFPSINSLPRVSLDYKKLDALTPNAYSPSPDYNRFPYGITPAHNPFYTVPYPLHYNMLSLPKVTPPTSVTSNRNIEPIGCTEDLNINPPLIKTQSAATFSPLFFENACSPKVIPKTLTVSPNLLNKELSRNLPLSVSSEYPQVRNSRTINNGESYNKIPDFSLKPMPFYEDPLSNFDPQPEIKDFTVPDLNFPEKLPFNVPDDYFSTAPFIKNIPEVPDIFPSSKNIKSSTHVTQKDATPSLKTASTSKSSSAINNFVSDITKKILTSINPRIKSPSLKKPGGKMKSYPNIARLQKQESGNVPALLSACKKLLKNKGDQHILSPSSDISQNTNDNTPMVLEPKTIIPAFSNDLYPSIQLPIAEVNSINTVIPSPAKDLCFSEPEKKAIFPVTYFAVDCQLSSPDISSPIVPTVLYETPLQLEESSQKLRKLNKNAETVEKLLELVFLAELLNGDDFVDWEALDDVLALLCVD